jgi:hypothetical protein
MHNLNNSNDTKELMINFVRLFKYCSIISGEIDFYKYIEILKSIKNNIKFKTFIEDVKIRG